MAKSCHQALLLKLPVIAGNFGDILSNTILYINLFIYKFLERHILKALWRFTILKINKKLQKTIKSLSKKKGLEAPFECV